MTVFTKCEGKYALWPKFLKYINILGFNKAGKKYLSSIKKDIKLSLKKDFDSETQPVEQPQNDMSLDDILKSL